MNNRDYKEFAKGEIYHIYNRGVGKMNIFKDEEDFKVFLFRLKENLFPELIKRRDLSKSNYRRKILPPNSFDLIAYCLMPNHFHLLIKQNSEISISVLVLKLCGGFSKYFNKKHNRVGSLFQDKFKAVRIQKNKQLMWTSLYIHENPLKAEITSNLSNYKWSSYSDYAGLENNNLCKKEAILGQFNSPKTYLNYFKTSENKKIKNKMIGCLDLLIDNE
ncbi:MAG: transposase [Candidatus Paceibacterota bacterium]|jgi:putative transposase